MDIYCHEESIKRGKIILRTYIKMHSIEFIDGNEQAFLWDDFTSFHILHRCCIEFRGFHEVNIE